LNEIEYRKLAVVEDSMWWFRGLRMNLDALIGRFVGKPTGQFLDAGCGTGGTLRHLNTSLGSVSLYGIDIFPQAVAFARERTTAHVAVSSVNALPFPDGCFRCIVSVDVICQRGVTLSRAISEFYRCIEPGGHLILQAPAYMWLWGYHDVQCHTAQRFTSSRLKSLLSEHGFVPCFASYWNMVLLPLLAFRRKLLPKQKTESDVREYPALLDRLFGGLVSFEALLIRNGVYLPFGSSVILVARK
jgi:SAM-dependent methyltransferase